MVAISMAQVPRVAGTAKDFRDYESLGAFMPAQFTRIFDGDLEQMWCALNKVHEVIGAPRFAQSGVQAKVAQVLSYGVRRNSRSVLIPRQPRTPEASVAHLLSLQYRLAGATGVLPVELVQAHIEHCLTTQREG